MRKVIELGEYMPDLPKAGNPGLRIAENVYWNTRGYRPVGAFSNAAAALSSAVKGFCSERRVNGDIISFAATATGLYWLNGGTSWTDKSLTTYAATSDWEFVRFKDNLFAVALGVNPQYFPLTAAFDPSSGSNKWANAAGSPPQFRHVGVCKGYVICGYEVSGGVTYDQRIRWSARDATFAGATDWTSNPTVTGSDFQDFDNGGPVRKVIGGDNCAIIMQEKAIRRLSPTSDTSLIFIPDVVEDGRGAMAPGVVTSQGDIVYYLSEDGFFAFDGSRSIPIGHGKVDKTFFNSVSLANIGYMRCAVDPYNKMVVWFYPSKSSGSSELDSGLCYNYADNKWTTLDLGSNVEFVASGISSGYTLDQLSGIFSSIDDVRPSLDDNFWVGGYRAMFFFNTSHRMGILRGDPLATRILTGEFQLGTDDGSVPYDRKKLTRTVRPGLDSDSAQIRVSSRENLQDDATFTDYATENSRGIAPARSVGRYHSVEISSSAGSDYETQNSLSIDYQMAGDA